MALQLGTTVGSTVGTTASTAVWPTTESATTSTTAGQWIGCHLGTTYSPTTKYLSRRQRSWPWQREQGGLMDYVPPSSGCASFHSEPATSRFNRHKAVWRENLNLFPWHLKALEAMPINWISAPKCNLPFDSASRYPVLSKEQLACSATLEHFIQISSVKKLPPETTNGLLSNFFPVRKKCTDNMRGCIDLRRSNQHIWNEHFKMEGLHTIQTLIQRNSLITKVDLSDFYMHFLIGQDNGRYMRSCGRARTTSALACPSDWPRPRGLPPK